MSKFERISVCNLVFFVLTWFGVYIDRCQEDLCLLWISSISLRLFFDKWISWISGCPDCRDSHVRRPTIPLGGWGQRGRYKHRDHDLYNLLVSLICTYNVCKIRRIWTSTRPPLIASPLNLKSVPLWVLLVTGQCLIKTKIKQMTFIAQYLVYFDFTQKLIFQSWVWWGSTEMFFVLY